MVEVTLDQITLSSGGHASRNDGVCATEAIAWLAGEPHSASPKCLSPVLRSFLQSWNDATDDEGREKLKPFLPRAIGTAGDGKDEERGWLAADWLVRVCTPTWLELAGIKESAAALRALPPLRDLDGLQKAQPVIDEARKKSAAARAAARDAAGDAAGDAARAAAWDAAGDAAGDAARAAAWDAAWDAARDAAWAAGTYQETYDAVREAADEAVTPTRIELQASALELLERLLDPEEKV
jgi:hypothetical protein